MIIPTNTAYLTEINSPVRRIMARVELYEGSTLLNTFSYDDRLIGFTVNRIGDSKFFGFGVCQKVNIKLIDRERELDIKTAHTFKILFGVGGEYINTLPEFKITEVHRDENTNELSITAYDLIYPATNRRTAELTISSFSIAELAEEVAVLLGSNSRFDGLENDTSINTEYENGANLDGTETLRELLNAIAEVTQTIYFVDKDNTIVFRRLNRDGTADYTITKDRYITLDSKTNRRLSTITHATELGDNITASLDVSGSTQYVRDNPLWELREDITGLVDAALAAIGGITINQFDCKWRGNFLLEIGDKLGLITKDNVEVYSYMIDDTITYDGAYSQETKWSYKDNEADTASNPTSLGDAVKQTYARVDKVNKEITLVASTANANSDSISSLIINTDSITSTIQSMEKNTADSIDGVKNDISELNNKVSATMTAEEVKLEIATELSNGASKVITNTGFTFDDTGLTVTKTDSEMETKITEDGMTVYKNSGAVLTANNIGVDAVNLHATTYLIIGNNSRFEDYGSDRTGCFWIGEVN